jgi:hypothetical protein
MFGTEARLPERGRREEKRALDRERAREIKRKDPELTYAQIARRVGRGATCIAQWLKDCR